MPLRRSRSYLLENPRHRKAEADRLDRQAQVLFPLERGALSHHGLAPGQTLLDLGCGQGSYLALVAGAFPGTRCIGLDRNAALLEEAAHRPGITAVARCDIATPAELLPALERYRPDVALCRFVLQHMSPDERLSMLTAMAAHARAVPLRLILADVDGTSSFVDPPSALLAEARAGLNEIQARNGGDRSVGGRLPQLLEEAGFKEIESSRVRVTSDAVGFAAWWRAFGSLLCLGLRSRPGAQQALLEWAADPQTAQRWSAGFDVCFASSATPGRSDG